MFIRTHSDNGNRLPYPVLPSLGGDSGVLRYVTHRDRQIQLQTMTCKRKRSLNEVAPLRRAERSIIKGNSLTTRFTSCLPGHPRLTLILTAGQSGFWASDTASAKPLPPEVEGLLLVFPETRVRFITMIVVSVHTVHTYPCLMSRFVGALRRRLNEILQRRR